jgi:IS5 family transposase
VAAFDVSTGGRLWVFGDSHVGYAISQCTRKRVEEIFGWMKTVGGFRRTRYRGLERTRLAGYLVAAAYNLVPMVKLMAAATAG